MAGSTFVVTDHRAPYREVDTGIQASAEQIRSQAQAATPVRTGALKAGWKVSKRRESEYVVSNDVPYARFVEYGTSDTAPHPMLAPAVLAGRARYV